MTKARKKTLKKGRTASLAQAPGSPKTVTRIKDLPETQNLGGVRFRYPGDGQAYYWSSHLQKGVWGKKDMSSGQIFPLFCDDLKDALEWEVLPNV